jgi:hypothetical protein
VPSTTVTATNAEAHPTTEVHGREDEERGSIAHGPNVAGAPSSQSLLVLRDGHRVNVILYGVTDVAIRPTVLAAVVAAL